MAAAANNVTGTASDDEGRPSIFELVSQQGFAHALRPAFFHIVKTLAEGYPARWLPPFMYRNFDEVYLAFDSLVQWHYMLTRGSTLSEAFYGLERVAMNEKINTYRVKVSFILSVILPYLTTKLDKVHKAECDKLSGTNSEQGTTSCSGINPKLVPVFIKVYPFVKAFLDLINLVCLLRYAFGYSKSHHLLFLSLGLRLTYASPSRTKFIEEKKSELFSPKSWSFSRFPTLLLRSLGESVLFGVEMGSFFVQFLDWWYNDPRRERVTLTSLPVPPALSETDQNFVAFTSQEKNVCPLCRRRFKNATALSTSGLVFCYGCITPYLKTHGKCPLTSITSNMHHLIRIFN